MPPADLLSELRALLPEAIPALGGAAVAGLAAVLVPTSTPRPTLDTSERDRLRLLLRQEQGWVEMREREIHELRSKLRAKEDENAQLQRAARASAQQAEELATLRRRLARSNGAPSAETGDLRTYAWCCQFRLLPKTQRPPTSPALRAQYLRVAKMYVGYGDALDQAGIAFRWIRYAAYGTGQFEQKVRAAQVLAGCRPRRELRPHRDLPPDVVTRLAWSGLEEATALIRRLVDEGNGAAFLG